MKIKDVPRRLREKPVPALAVLFLLVLVVVFFRPISGASLLPDREEITGCFIYPHPADITAELGRYYYIEGEELEELLDRFSAANFHRAPSFKNANTEWNPLWNIDFRCTDRYEYWSLSSPEEIFWAGKAITLSGDVLKLHTPSSFPDRRLKTWDPALLDYLAENYPYPYDWTPPIP